MTYRKLFHNLRNKAKASDKEESAVKLLFLDTAKFTYNDLILNYSQEVPHHVYKTIMKRFALYIDQNIPIQYILGYSYFYGLKIYVDDSVLIPRPETEVLVEKILEYYDCNSKPKILDLGCGSGAIALALKNNIPDADITAVDVSSSAIKKAKANAAIYNLQINFIISNLFAGITGKFDIIVSNPPYLIDKNEAELIVCDNEPSLALYAPEKGLYFYERILSDAPSFINIPGMIFFEIPANKDTELLKCLNKFGLDNKYIIEKDLNGQNRILIIKYD